MELEDYPEKKIQVFDTLSAGLEMELILQQILREIRAGGSFEEICARITDYRKRTKLAFVLYSMDNLVKNGRVSKIAGFAASLLGIAVLMPTGGLCSYYAEQGGLLIGYEAGQREFSVEKMLSAMKPEKVPDRVI